MWVTRPWKLLVRLGWLVFLLACLLQTTGLVTGTQAGPLSQWADNVHKLHIAARYRSTAAGRPIIAVILQTVVATAVKSDSSVTYWVIEPEHVDPEFFYRERHVPRGTPIKFQFFIDTFRPEAVVDPNAGDPVSVARLEQNYALLREARARDIPEAAIASPLQAGEEVSIIGLAEWDFTHPAALEERTAHVVRAGTPLAFIDLPLEEEAEDEHGEPVFALRDGSWQLAGIRVDHGRSPRPDWGAVAQLPPLSDLIPPPPTGPQPPRRPLVP